VAFECAGHPGSVRGCLEALRPMGRYTQIAICGPISSFQSICSLQATPAARLDYVYG